MKYTGMDILLTTYSIVDLFVFCQCDIVTEQTVNNNRFKYRENNTLVLEYHYCNEHDPSNIYESLRCICTLVMQITIYAYTLKTWKLIFAKWLVPFLFFPILRKWSLAIKIVHKSEYPNQKEIEPSFIAKFKTTSYTRIHKVRKAGYIT